MNIAELKAEMARQNITIPQLADLIKISKKTLYSRIKEETCFTQPEIVAIAKVLNLSDSQIFVIFFSSEVA